MDIEKILNYFGFIDTRNMTIPEFIKYFFVVYKTSLYSLNIKIPNKVIIEDFNGNQLYYGLVHDSIILDLLSNNILLNDYKCCVNEQFFDDLPSALAHINYFESLIPTIKIIKINNSFPKHKLYFNSISIIDEILTSNNIKLIKIMIGNHYFYYPEYYLPYSCNEENIKKHNKDVNSIYFQILD